MKTLQTFFLLGALSFVLNPVFSIADAMVSAKREGGKSYKSYLLPQPFSIRPEWKNSVEGRASVFKTEENFKNAMKEHSFHEHTVSDFENAFLWIRDIRFLSVTNFPNFKRRITWLYPDDGCFTRAEMAIRKLKELEFNGLMKIFVFGDLEAETVNNETGRVQWWFHVAPLIKADDEFYVIDAAIEPGSYLTVSEWLKRMNVDYSTSQIAVCHESAYDPYSQCLQSDYIHDREVEAHQTRFLHREWYRMIELGRDPEQVLGDHPPWGLQQLRKIHY